MSVFHKRGPLPAAVFLLMISAAAFPAHADEIQLKDGKKLYGVIVAYEDNMFKVKTDYGFVLVEKDKIAKIIPSTPASKSEPQPAAKKDVPPARPKPAGDSQPQTEPAVGSSADAPTTATNTSEKSASSGTLL